jgi:hypothetical protein
MNKEFIPYEQALELKELGFDEPCMFPYHRNNTNYIDSTHVELANYNATEKLVSAVLYQQGFRWFRENYGYYHILNYNAEFDVWVLTIADYTYKQFSIKKYNTYEDAEFAAIKKLIEVAKNNVSNLVANA